MSYALHLYRGQGYQDCAPPTDQIAFECAGAAHASAYRLPGYPLWLTFNLFLFGDQHPIEPIRLLQSVLITLIAFATVQFAARLGGTVAAMIAGGLMLVNIPMYTYAYMLFTETLFTALLLIFGIVLVYARRARSFVLLGILIGLLLLTRGTLLLTLPLLLFVIPRRRWGLVAMGALLLIIPWTLRNWITLGRLIPFSSGSGAVLWGADNPVSFGVDPAKTPSGLWLEPEKLPDWSRFQALDEFARDSAETRAALDFLHSVPLPKLVQTELIKVANLHGYSDVWYDAVAMGLCMLSVLALALLALRTRVRTRIRRAVQDRDVRTFVTLCAALWIGAIVNALVFFSFVRFRAPLMPYWVIIGGLCVSLLFGIPLKRAPRKA